VELTLRDGPHNLQTFKYIAHMDTANSAESNSRDHYTEPRQGHGNPTPAESNSLFKLPRDIQITAGRLLIKRPIRLHIVIQNMWIVGSIEIGSHRPILQQLGPPPAQK
jgi:hypothetical protein